LKYSHLIFFIFCSLFISAQKNSKTDFENRVDSSLVNSIFYIPGENAFNPKFHAINPGSHQFSIEPLLMDYGWSSRLFASNYSEINIERDSIPNLDVQYDYGMETSHWFNIDFYRPVGKSDLFLKFNRNYSDNLYANTEVESRNFILGSKIYFSDSYSLTIGYFNNQTTKSESGGVWSTSDYKSNNELSTYTIDPNLSSAKNNILNNGFILKQQIKLYSQKDSLLKEQLQFGIILETKLEEDRYTFSMDQGDLDSAYFPNIYLDSTQTFDSIGFKKLIIKPSLYWISVDKTKSLEIGYEKKLYDYSILSRSNIFLSSNYRKGNLTYKLSGKYELESFWKSNYKVSFGLNKQYENRNNLKFVLSSESKTPEFLFIHYSGNHFNWDTDFSSVNLQSAKLKYTFNMISTSIEGELNHFSNYIYFNESTILNQTNAGVIISKVNIKNVIGYKQLKLTSGIVGQFSNSSLIRIPNFYTRSSFAFNFFIRKVPMSVGGIFTYFTSYKGLDYNPAIRHFKLGTSTVGGFSVVDVFFVARVGSADLSIKYDNLFFESENRDMFLGTNYPLAKPFLHFGLKWNLKN
jgi:hypothetical protein